MNLSSWNVYKDGGLVRHPEDVVDLKDLIARDPLAISQDPEGFLKSHGCVLPGSISLAEAKATAKKRSRNIFANWNALQGILERHEETICKRWSKKSREGRKRILLDAWPGISQEHLPEWKALTITANERGLTGPIRAPDAKFRDAFLLPHLNLEDLANPKALLVLFHARGRNPPDTFAFSDYQSVKIGLSCKCIIPALVEDDGHYLMCIAGHSSPEAYGSIYSEPADASR